jgi:diguanylate cyclase (GGDEF)-like protein/PAS domain S-box-containing protein
VNDASTDRGDSAPPVRDEHDLATLLEEFPEVVLVLSASGLVRWANRRAEEVFGVSLADAVGASVLDLVHPDDLELVRRSFESVQHKQVGNPIEVRVRVRGQWRLIELIGRPVGLVEDGAILFALRDVTQRRRFEVAHDDVAQFRALVHNIDAIIVETTPEGIVRSVSGSLTRRLGHDPEDLEGVTLGAIVADEDRARFDDAVAVAAAATDRTPVIRSLRLVDREHRVAGTYELSLVNMGDDPVLEGLVVTAHDVSTRVAAEQRLHEVLDELHATLSLLHATIESAADGLIVVDRERRVVSSNQMFVTLWRIAPSLLRGPYADLLAAILERVADPDVFRARAEELYAHPTLESDDLIALRDGRTFRRLSRPQRVDDQIVGRVWSFSDVTAQKTTEEALTHLAFHDPLTGLVNRALLRDRLDEALARSERSGRSVALLYLDVDDFKSVNDALGHRAGDALLCAVANGLSRCVRRSDSAARLGGDEFAVLVEDVDDGREVEALAERIRATLAEPVTIDGRDIETTVSIGVAFADYRSTSEEILHDADLAMYQAKSNGKNRYEVSGAQRSAAGGGRP